ncbi:hypothetical protein [Membranihabitans marinus]|uniref:hypothetical protein n=1 Tax=Membranihabitans marinus TaxID=1227546 RepID=UPI001F2DD38F|nr:hypothetical protein [Membranihabitans marinus]
MTFFNHTIKPYIGLAPQCIRQYHYTLSTIRQANATLNIASPSDRKVLYRKKHSLFYGCLVPNVLHHCLATIHRIPLPSIRETATLQALITGVYDDLIDDYHYNIEDINRILFHSSPLVKDEIALAQYCRYLFHNIQCKAANPDLLQKITPLLILAQERSKLQNQSSLGLEEILSITYEKGGYAMLFYRSAILPVCHPVEHDFLYALGGLMQMTNDINDALKDRLNHSSTLMTSDLSLSKITDLFWEKIRDVNHLWWLFKEEDGNPYLARIRIILIRSLITLELYGHHTSKEYRFDIDDIPQKTIIQSLRIPIYPKLWFKYDRKLRQLFSEKPVF